MKRDSFLSVQQNLNVDYLKSMVADLKKQNDVQGFAEARALQFNESTDFERTLSFLPLSEEIQIAHEEIRRKEKDMGRLLQLTEFLLQKSEELERRVEDES